MPTNTAPTGVLLLGDVNLDGHVNNTDVSLLITALSD